MESSRRSRRFVFPDRATTVSDALPIIRSALEDEGLGLAPQYSHGKITSVLAEATSASPAGVEFRVPVERVVDLELAASLRLVAAEHYERARLARQARDAQEGVPE